MLHRGQDCTFSSISLRLGIEYTVVTYIGQLLLWREATPDSVVYSNIYCYSRVSRLRGTTLLKTLVCRFAGHICYFYFP